MFGKKKIDEKPQRKPKSRPVPPYEYTEYDGLNPTDDMDAETLVNGCGMFYNVLPPEKKAQRRYQQMAVKSAAAAYLLLPKDAQKRDDITEIMNTHLTPKDPAKELPMEKRIAILKKMQEIEVKKAEKRQKKTDDLVFNAAEIEELNKAMERDTSGDGAGITKEA